MAERQKPKRKQPESRAIKCGCHILCDKCGCVECAVQVGNDVIDGPPRSPSEPTEDACLGCDHSTPLPFDDDAPRLAIELFDPEKETIHDIWDTELITLQLHNDKWLDIKPGGHWIDLFSELIKSQGGPDLETLEDDGEYCLEDSVNKPKYGFIDDWIKRHTIDTQSTNCKESLFRVLPGVVRYWRIDKRSFYDCLDEKDGFGR